jgi:hypothetical protein
MDENAPADANLLLKLDDELDMDKLKSFPAENMNKFFKE